MSSGTPAAALPTFTFDDSVKDWSVTANEYISKHNKTSEWDGLATANVVFNPSNRILMIQRASHDSMPNRWELPGGAVDNTDPSILHGAARELFEESGLIAKNFSHIVTEGPNHGAHAGQAFPNSTKTKIWCRFTFEVDVTDCSVVKLDPNEHQDYVWASEEEVREQRSSTGRDLPITRESMRALMLEAFRLRKQRVGSL